MVLFSTTLFKYSKIFSLPLILSAIIPLKSSLKQLTSVISAPLSVFKAPSIHLLLPLKDVPTTPIWGVLSISTIKGFPFKSYPHINLVGSMLIAL